ncbi:hypothetical protein OIU78_028538 [Salix suchowensis]|nr:hypothetical protein OIU78_028538 [Salix suchowensis]
MENLSRWLFCFLVSTAVIAAAGGREIYDGEEARREADRVLNLPGQPQVKFQHYSGYVKLGPPESKGIVLLVLRSRRRCFTEAASSLAQWRLALPSNFLSHLKLKKNENFYNDFLGG